MDLALVSTEVVVILLLALTNGLLAMSEMAMVSSRRSKLQQLAQDGSSGAEVALELLKEPSRFLASIQIGITTIGVMAGAFGGANLAEQLAAYLARNPLLASYSEAIALSFVVFLVSLLSLIFGELVPKRLALGSSETIAVLMSKPIRMLSKMARPAVYFLGWATEGVLKLMRYRQPQEAAVTDEELYMLVEQGANAGLFEREEESIIKRTLRLGDKTAEEVMTKRVKLVALDIQDPLADNLVKMRDSGFSYFPVYRAELDTVVGVVSIRSLFASLLEGHLSDLRPYLQEPLYVPETMPALKLLESFKASGKQFAVVIDEYGGFSGIVTAMDLLESIVGDLPEHGDLGEQTAVLRDDGSWLLDGMLSLDDVIQSLAIKDREFFPKDVQSLGGFIMNTLGRIPKTGEKFTWKDWEFEVVDMDGNRVDKVLVKKLANELNAQELAVTPSP